MRRHLFDKKILTEELMNAGLKQERAMLVVDALESAIEQAFFSRDMYKEKIEDNLRHFEASIKREISDAASTIMKHVGALLAVAVMLLSAIKYLG